MACFLLTWLKTLCSEARPCAPPAQPPGRGDPARGLLAASPQCSYFRGPATCPAATTRGRWGSPARPPTLPWGRKGWVTPLASLPRPACAQSLLSWKPPGRQPLSHTRRSPPRPGSALFFAAARGQQGAPPLRAVARRAGGMGPRGALPLRPGKPRPPSEPSPPPAPPALRRCWPAPFRSPPPELRGCGPGRVSPGAFPHRSASAQRGPGVRERGRWSGRPRPGEAVAAGRQKAAVRPPLRQRGVRGRSPSSGSLRQGRGPPPWPQPSLSPPPRCGVELRAPEKRPSC